MKTTILSLLVTFIGAAHFAAADMCPMLAPHVECRTCSTADPVPLAKHFIAARFCTTEDRAAKYATLDDGQKESALLVILTESDTARFVLVWKPRAGDADDVTLPIYRGIYVKGFVGDSSMDLYEAALSDYRLSKMLGYDAAIVSTNDPKVPIITVTESEIRCARVNMGLCPAPSRRRAAR